MLVDYEFKNSNLILSIIDKSGNIKLRHYPWSPTKFIQTSLDDPERHGKFVTWSGNAVKSIYTKYPNKYAVYDYIDTLPEEDQEIIYGYNEPNIYFVDIENEILDSKPRPHLAESKVLSISIITKNKALVIGIDPLTKKEQRSIQVDINNEYGTLFEREWEFKYVQYKCEYDMMLQFFKVFVPRMPVITGWNFKHYDWVFLVNRARILGIDPTISSFTGKMMEENQNDPRNYCELPAHRIIIDYMEIFKKWDTSIKVKESMSLDFISEKVLKVKKVNYEGNLKILYETDFKKFIFYNAVDSILVQMIHEKSKLADILYGIATLSRTTVTKALSTLSITEGILRKKLRIQKNIVLVKNENIGTSSPVKGGWVKEPIRGMSTWTCCYDFASLYPMTMRQFNISADSYKGQKIKDQDMALFNGYQVELVPNDIITKNGAVFRNEDGVVTQVMAEVYADRKSYKKTMMAKNFELDQLTKELKELEDSII